MTVIKTGTYDLVKKLVSEKPNFLKGVVEQTYQLLYKLDDGNQYLKDTIIEEIDINQFKIDINVKTR